MQSIISLIEQHRTVSIDGKTYIEAGHAVDVALEYCRQQNAAIRHMADAGRKMRFKQSAAAHICSIPQFNPHQKQKSIDEREGAEKVFDIIIMDIPAPDNRIANIEFWNIAKSL